MFDSLLVLFKNLPDYALWAVPIVGALACGVAFVVGRRMLTPPLPVQDPDEVLIPGSQVYQGVTQDRRASPRRKGGNSVEVQISFGEEQSQVRAWVVDRSIGGLCILAEQPIMEGTLLRLRPRSTGESLPWTDVTVRSCRQDGAYHELGCQFHRTPNWNMLLQFG